MSGLKLIQQGTLRTLVVCAIVGAGNVAPLGLGQVPLPRVVVTVDPAKVTESITALLRELKDGASVEVRQAITSAVSKVNRDAKLVVATVEIPVTAYKYVENMDFAGLKVVGRQMVVVEAPSNRVQYSIPLAGIRPENLTIDPENFSVRLVVPRPRLDDQMIVLDREKMVAKSIKGGLAPISDEALAGFADQLKDTEVKKIVVGQAGTATNLSAVSDAGREAVANLLRSIFTNDKLFGQMPWLRIEVLYEDEIRGDQKL